MKCSSQSEVCAAWLRSFLVPTNASFQYTFRRGASCLNDCEHSRRVGMANLARRLRRRASLSSHPSLWKTCSELRGGWSLLDVGVEQSLELDAGPSLYRDHPVAARRRIGYGRGPGAGEALELCSARGLRLAAAADTAPDLEPERGRPGTSAHRLVELRRAQLPDKTASPLAFDRAGDSSVLGKVNLQMPTV